MTVISDSELHMTDITKPILIRHRVGAMILAISDEFSRIPSDWATPLDHALARLHSFRPGALDG